MIAIFTPSVPGGKRTFSDVVCARTCGLRPQLTLSALIIPRSLGYAYMRKSKDSVRLLLQMFVADWLMAACLSLTEPLRSLSSTALPRVDRTFVHFKMYIRLCVPRKLANHFPQKLIEFSMRWKKLPSLKVIRRPTRQKMLCVRTALRTQGSETEHITKLLFGRPQRRSLRY